MTRATKDHPKAGVTRGKRVRKSVDTSGSTKRARKERGDDRDDQKGHDTLSYYFHDMQDAGELLLPEEEIVIGRQVKVIIAETVERMQALLESDNAVLEAKPQPEAETETETAARKKRVREAEERRSAINPDALTGDALKAHLEEMATGRQGLDYIKRYGPPSGGLIVERFIKANLRLVVSLAWKYRRKGSRYELEDSIQDGNIGLMIAVIRYDHRRGNRFSTFASWWIRHAVTRGLSENGRLIRLPVHLTDFLYAIDGTERYLTKKLGAKPPIEDVARAFLDYQLKKKDKGRAQKPTPKQIEDLVKKIKDARKHLSEPVSISAPINRGSDDDGWGIEETLHEEEPDVRPCDELNGERLASAMAELTPIERDVLRQRFGLGMTDELTFREIGYKYRLSRERIRQIQNRALERLRLSLAKHLTA